VGYFVEYSGLRFGMFYLGEFLEVIGSSALMVNHLPGRLADMGDSVLPNWAHVLLSMLVWGGKVFSLFFSSCLCAGPCRVFARIS